MSALAYRQLWRVVSGAVSDALGSHPDYLTAKGRTSAHTSIVKRVTGTVLGFAEEARGRSGDAPAAETGLSVAATDIPSGGAPSRLPKNSGTSQPKENGRAPEDRDRGDIRMLNVIEKAPTAQRVTDFVAEGFQILTAVQANIVLLDCEYEGQRGISSDHVDVLADIMKRNQWEAKDKIDFALHGHRLVLINGYHRMHAQVRSGKAIEWTIVIHKCRTSDDVRKLYYTFDTNTRLRSGRQIMAGVGYAERTGLSKEVAAGLFNAVPFLANKFTTGKIGRNYLDTRVMDRRLRIADDYVDAAKAYEKCLVDVPGKVRRKFLTGGVTAVAVATLRYQPVVAYDFWYGAAQNDGLRKGDPRQTLFNDLMVRQMNTGSQAQSAIAPAIAWNAFYENRSLKIIKIYDRAVRIVGTPFED